MPYVVGTLCCLIGMGILYGRRHHLTSLARVDVDHRVEAVVA